VRSTNAPTTYQRDLAPDAAARAEAMDGVALDAAGERQLAKAAIYGNATTAACQHQGSGNVE
jgi:hypothetical protein